MSYDSSESLERFLSRTDVREDRLAPDRIRSMFLQLLMNSHMSMTLERSNGVGRAFLHDGCFSAMGNCIKR